MGRLFPFIGLNFLSCWGGTERFLDLNDSLNFLIKGDYCINFIFIYLSFLLKALYCEQDNNIEEAKVLVIEDFKILKEEEARRQCKLPCANH